VTISVGIPAYNEEKTISKLLHSLREQPTNGFLLKEIVVNASGSTDGTKANVQAMMPIDSRIKLIYEIERGGKAAALNEILRCVSGDLVLFLDADVALGKNAVQNLITPLLQNQEIGVCSGNVMPLKDLKQKGFFEFASLFTRELHHELCGYLMSKGLAPKVNGTFYAFRSGIVSSIPPLVVSDDEYVSWRAQEKGYQVVYVPNALVFATDPHRFTDFIQWQTRILAGQLYMKRHFNYDVPTMRMSVAIRGGVVKLFSKYRRKVLSLLALFILATLSFFLAYVKLVHADVPYAY